MSLEKPHLLVAVLPVAWTAEQHQASGVRRNPR